MSDLNSNVSESLSLLLGVGVRLREERERLGVSQVSLAEYTGLTQNTISKYENSVTFPSIVFIYKLKIIGFDVYFVLFNQRSGFDSDS